MTPKYKYKPSKNGAKAYLEGCLRDNNPYDSLQESKKRLKWFQQYDRARNNDGGGLKVIEKYNKEAPARYAT